MPVTLSGVSVKDRSERGGKKILKKHVSNRIGKQEKQNFNDYFFKSKLGKHHNG
jgi:hypothetical protein